MSDYDLGRHDERRRTMQLIGGVRMDAQTGAAGDVLDKLVTCIASEPLPDVRPPAVPLDVRELIEEVWDKWIPFGLQNAPAEYCRDRKWKVINELSGRIAAALTTTPAASGPLLHWPFAAKHDNCAECNREYEPVPKQDALSDAPSNAATGAQTCVYDHLPCSDQPAATPSISAAIAELEQRLNYYEAKDFHNGWSGNESGPCCNACAMRDEHFTGRADSLKALVGCRNPFQLPKVCQCHVPTRQAVRSGVISALNQVLQTLRTLQPSTPSEREQFLAHIDQCGSVLI